LLACAGGLALGLPPAALFTRLRSWAASCSHQTCASACSPAFVRSAEPIGHDFPGALRGRIRSRRSDSRSVRRAKLCRAAARTLRRCNRTPLLRFLSPSALAGRDALSGAAKPPDDPASTLLTGLRPARPRIPMDLRGTFADRWRPCGFSLFGCDAVVLDVGTCAGCGDRAVSRRVNAAAKRCAQVERSSAIVRAGAARGNRCCARRTTRHIKRHRFTGTFVDVCDFRSR